MRMLQNFHHATNLEGTWGPSLCWLGTEYIKSMTWVQNPGGLIRALA